MLMGMDVSIMRMCPALNQGVIMIPPCQYMVFVTVQEDS